MFFWLKNKDAFFLTYRQLLKCKFFLCVLCGRGWRGGTQGLCAWWTLNHWLLSLAGFLFPTPSPRSGPFCVCPWLSLNSSIWLVLYQHLAFYVASRDSHSGYYWAYTAISPATFIFSVALWLAVLTLLLRMVVGTHWLSPSIHCMITCNQNHSSFLELLLWYMPSWLKNQICH